MMTADEALVIVETVLDYQSLNQVQEIIFRECWEGRRSYREIAKNSGYEPDYIKDVGAKLWKLLSEAFGEKVTKGNVKSVLKQVSRGTQVNSQRNLLIEVNLSGANLSGVNLSGAKLIANLIEYQADSQAATISDDNIESEEDIIDSEQRGDRQLHNNSDKQVYYWHGFKFYSDAEVKIAEALDRLSILFFPHPQLRLNTSEGRRNQQPSFVILYQGKVGIMQIDDEGQSSQRESENPKMQNDFIFNSQDIGIIQHYEANRCRQESEQVIQEFLDILTHT